MPTTETLPNYAPVIRAQIEREVAKAKVRIENTSPYSRAGRVSIGYITNSHKGKPIFAEGDKVAGLPVTIDRREVNVLTVHSLSGDVKLR